MGFFCLILLGHIILLYYYSDAVKYPLPGGTVNVWILGEKPVLNVLNFDTKIENDPNDTVLRFVYRGLLRFSPTEKKIVSDLANCDIDNFPTIQCKLNQNALWSDGAAITKDDVISTYTLFKEKAHNEYTKWQLSMVELSANEDTIVFKFKTRDITSIQSLFLPIVRQKDLVEEWSGDVGETLSFSGPYIFTNKENQKKSIFLARNPYYTHTNRPYFFDQVRFGFGMTNNEIYKIITPDIFLSHTPSEGKNTQWTTYIRPVFYGAFMNTEKLPISLRKTIFLDILGTIDTKDEFLMAEENVFLGDVPNAPRSTKENTFFQAVSALWYTFGGTFQVPESKPVITPKKPLQYITDPGKTSPLFIPNATIELRGTVPDGTTKVIINGYTLRNFTAGKKTFAYTAKREFTNLVIGQNIYRVSFYAGAKLLAEEPVIIYHDTDAASLEAMKSTWDKENTIITPTTESADVPPPSNLDPKKLYNKDGKPLIFRVIVQSNIPYLSHVAGETKRKLEELWSEVIMEELSVGEIKSNLSKPEFSYDIILTGINLGLFHYNVAPFLHSSQIKNGYNIVRIRDSALDTLLTRLTDKLYYSSPDKLRDIQVNIQKILDREFAVYTLGSPYEYVWTKNTIKGFKIPEFITGRETLLDTLSRAYFKEWYKLSPEPKNIIWFFSWLKNELFPSA